MTTRASLSYYAWPASIVAFFIVLAGGNVVLYRLANDSDESRLIESGPYERGLEFQKKLDALERFRKEGYRSVARISGASDDAELVVSITKQDGSPLSGVSVAASVTFAPSPTLDQQLVLRETEPGSGEYRASLRARFGTFLVNGSFVHDGRTLAFEERVQLSR